ncbi:helix-turn-helix domain-containing protein [Bradyrhizobium ottawaense]|uniref:helix-turn-helix domain-containing protein n=1 Tax=Bradyrhizobium ottawaense TaxID=931866 RepID=UPI0035119168
MQHMGSQMNAKAMEWAHAQTSLSILQKSILIHLASLADSGMFVEGQSQQALATLVGCSRSAANRALNNLARLGRIRIHRILGRDGQMPCAYFLNCPGEKMSGESGSERILRWNKDRRKAAA